MNKIYRIIWSDARHAYTVVSEIAKTQGKKSSESLGKPVRALLAAAVLTCGFLASAPGTQAAAPEVANTANHQYVAMSPGGNWDAVKSWPYVFVADDNTIVYGQNGADYKDGTTGGTMDSNGNITNGNVVRLGKNGTDSYRFTGYKDGVYTLTNTTDSSQKVNVYRYGYYTLDVPNANGNGTSKVPYRVRADEQGATQPSYGVTVVRQGGYYTSTDKLADGRTAPSSQNVFVVSYQGQGDAPRDVLTKVDHVASDTGVRTNLQEQLQTVAASTYTSAATGGSTIGGTWDYYIYDDATNSYRNMHQTGSSGFPNRFVQVTDASKFTWNDSYNAYVYTNNGTETIVPQDNMYVIGGQLGIFTNSDGSLYTGTVYGGGNEILLTTSEGGKIYSFWGAQSVDTAQTMSTYPVAKYNTDIETLTNNDKVLAHNDINSVKGSSAGTALTLGMYRNGSNMNGEKNVTNLVSGSEVKFEASGGTGGIAANVGGNDRTLTISGGGASHPFNMGSRVGVTSDLVSGTSDLQRLTINGTPYNLRLNFQGDTGNAITKDLGSTLSITGGATTGLTTGNIGVVNENGALNVRLNKDVNLGSDGSLTMNNTKVTADGLTITGGPSVLTTGVNAGGLQVTNVASGAQNRTWTSADRGYDVNWNNAANIGDLHQVVDSDVLVQGNKNITVNKTKAAGSTQSVYTVNLNDNVTLGNGGNATSINLNGTNTADGGQITMGTGATRINLNSVKGQSNVAGVKSGNFTAADAVNSTVYTKTTTENYSPNTEGTKRFTYKNTTIQGVDSGRTESDGTHIIIPGVAGTAQTGTFVSGLTNTDWDWRNLSIVKGRAATEDELLKAGQHFFSINPQVGVTDMSTIPNYFNNGAKAAASMAVGHGVSTNPSATGSIAIGANGTSTGRVTTTTTTTNGTTTTRTDYSGGDFALAVGNNAKAEGSESMAIGHQADAAGDRSLSIGNQNYANGIRSIAIGVNVQSGYANDYANVYNDSYSSGQMIGGANIAVGNRTRVNGTGSTALGFGATIGKINSDGTMDTNNSADLAVALGGRTEVTQDGGVALGNTSVSNRAAGSSNAYMSDFATGADGKVSADAVKAAKSTDSMGTLKATYTYDDKGNITGVANQNTLQDGTAWRSNMGAVSIGSDTARTAVGGDKVPVITRQLTGLAAGTGDTDAVNVAQLKAVVAAGQNFVGENKDTDDSLVKVHNNIGDTLAVQGAANATNTGTPLTTNIYVAADKDGQKLNISLKDDVNVHTVTAGTAGNNGRTGTVSIVGNNASEGSAPNYVAYDIKAGKGAEDLTSPTHTDRLTYTDGNDTHTIATLDDGLRFKGDDASVTDTTNHVVRKLMDQDMSITGGAATTNLSDNNIGVVSNDDNTGLVVKLAKDVDNLSTVTAGDKTNGKTGVKMGAQTVNKTDASTTNPGTETGNYVSGLDNKDWTVGQTNYVSGRAATEDQLKHVSDQLGSGWEAQVGGKKLKDVKYDANNEVSRQLNFAAGRNMTASGAGSTITYATDENVGFTTVHVAGEGDGSTMTGGITLGNQSGLERKFTTVTESEQRAADGTTTTVTFNPGSGVRTTTVKNAAGDVTSTTTENLTPARATDDAGNYITGLGNKEWINGQIVSGRAATEDQLQTVANQIRGETSAADVYLTGGSVAYNEKGAGTSNLTMSQSTVQAPSITGLHDYYVANASLKDNILTITRNDDTVADGVHTAQWDIDLSSLKLPDMRLVGAGQNQDGAYTIGDDGNVTLTVTDGTNTKNVVISGLAKADAGLNFGANADAKYTGAKNADGTRKVALGNTIKVLGKTADAARSYSDTNITTELDADGNIHILMDDNPTVNSINFNTTGNLAANTAGDRLTYKQGTDGTPQEIAYTSDGLSFAGNTGDTVSKKLSDTTPLKIVGDADSTTAVTNGAKNVSVAGSSTDGSLTIQLAKDISGFDTVKAGNDVTVGKADDGNDYVTGLDNKTWIVGETTPVSGRAATEDQLKNVSDAANTNKTDITELKQGWNLAVNDDTANAVKAGKTVTLNNKQSTDNQGNIQISHSSDTDGNQTVSFGLNKDVTLGTSTGTETGGSLTVNASRLNTGDTTPRSVAIDGRSVNVNQNGNTDAKLSTSAYGGYLELSGGNLPSTTTAGGTVRLYRSEDADSTGIPRLAYTTVDADGNTGTRNTLAALSDGIAVTGDTTTDGNGTDTSASGNKVKLNKKLAVNGDDNITTTSTADGQDGASVKVALKSDLTGINSIAGNNDKIELTNSGISLSSTNSGSTVNVNNQKITNLTAGTEDSDAVNVSQLKNATGGWDVTANGGTAKTISTTKAASDEDTNGKNARTLNFAQGKNMSVSWDGTANNTINIATNDDVEFNSVWVNQGAGENPTGIHLGNQTVQSVTYNVTDGLGVTTPTRRTDTGNYIMGLQNLDWTSGQYVSGRAATEDQLQKVAESITSSVTTATGNDKYLTGASQVSYSDAGAGTLTLNRAQDVAKVEGGTETQSISGIAIQGLQNSYVNNVTLDGSTLNISRNDANNQGIGADGKTAKWSVDLSGIKTKDTRIGGAAVTNGSTTTYTGTYDVNSVGPDNILALNVVDSDGNPVKGADNQNLTVKIKGLAWQQTVDKGLNFGANDNSANTVENVATAKNRQLGETQNIKGRALTAGTERAGVSTQGANTFSTTNVTTRLDNNGDIEIDLADNPRLQSVILNANGTGSSAITLQSGSTASGLKTEDNHIRPSYTVGDKSYNVADLTDGMNYTGDNSVTDTSGIQSNVMAKTLNSKVNLKGGADVANLSDGNIGVVIDNNKDEIDVKLSKDVKDLNTVTAGTVKMGVQAGTGNTTNPTSENGNFVTGLDNKTWEVGTTTAVSGRAATEDQLKNVSDTVNTNRTDITELKQGWNLKSDNDTTGNGAKIQAKDTVTIGTAAGSNAVNNLTATRTDKNVAISLNKDVTLGSATEGGSLTVQNGNAQAKLSTGDNGGTLSLGGSSTEGNTGSAAIYKSTDGSTTDLARLSYKNSTGDTAEHKLATLDDGTTFAGDTGEKKVNLNKKVTVKGDSKNISTEAAADGDNANINVKLASDLQDINSVSGNGSKIALNNGGVTISGGPVNVSNNKITGVANGEISATSTDAINGSQLYQRTGGWDVQTNGTALKTVSTEAGSENRTLNFKNGDNIAVTGSGSDITVATTPTVGFTTVHVAGEGTGSAMTGGITIGSQDGSYVHHRRDENDVLEKDESGAYINDPTVDSTTTGVQRKDTNVKSITGLENKTWDGKNFVSGRAATEDQLMTVAENVTNNVTSNDRYVTKAEVTTVMKPGTTDQPNGQMTGKLTLSNNSTVDITGLHDYFITGGEVTTVDKQNEDGSTTKTDVVRLTRNDGHTFDLDISSLANTDYQLVGAGGTAGDTTPYTVDANGDMKLTVYDTKTKKSNTITLSGLASKDSTMIYAADNTTYKEDGKTVESNASTKKLGEVQKILGSDSAKGDGQTYTNGNIRTEVNPNTGDIVISMNDNPVLKSIILQSTDNSGDTIKITKGGDGQPDRLTVTPGTAGSTPQTVAYTSDGLNFTGDNTAVTVKRALNSTLAVTGDADTADANHANIHVNGDNASGLKISLDDNVHADTFRAGNVSANREGSVSIVGKAKDGLQEVKITSGYDAVNVPVAKNVGDSDSITRLQYTGGSGSNIHMVATLEDGYKLSADNGSDVNAGLNRTIKVTGGGNKAANLAAADASKGDNIGVTISKDDSNNATYTLQLNQDLTGLNSVTATNNSGSATFGNQTVSYDRSGGTGSESGLFVSGLTNRNWTVKKDANGNIVYGSNGLSSGGSITNTDGTYSIVNGRAATEDQLLALQQSLTSSIQKHENSTYGLTADDTQSVSKTLGSNIDVKGKVKKAADGSDVILYDKNGNAITYTTTVNGVETTLNRQARNVETSVQNGAIAIDLADHLNLGVTDGATSSINMFGNHETGTKDVKVIRINPDGDDGTLEGGAITITHKGATGMADQKDGVRIQGPSDTYLNADGSHSYIYDTNGSFSITNNLGEVTARLGDSFASGYLGLGNTLSTMSKVNAGQIRHLNPLTASTRAAVAGTDTPYGYEAGHQGEAGYELRDDYGQIIYQESHGKPVYMTDANGNVQYHNVDYYGETRSVPIPAVWDTASGVKVNENGQRVDDYGQVVYRVDGKGNVRYQTDENGNILTHTMYQLNDGTWTSDKPADGTWTGTTAQVGTPAQDITAGAIMFSHYGEKSLNSNMNTKGQVSGVGSGLDGQAMTRLAYWDEDQYDPSTTQVTGSTPHELATLDDGLLVAGNTGSAASRLNKTMTLRGTTPGTAVATRRTSSSNVYTRAYTDANSPDGTSYVDIGLNRDIRGLSTIQVGGTDENAELANNIDGTTIKIGNQGNGETANVALTDRNFSNFRYVDTDANSATAGTTVGPYLYKAEKDGNTYFTSDANDTNIVKEYRVADSTTGKLAYYSRDPNTAGVIKDKNGNPAEVRNSTFRTTPVTINGVQEASDLAADGTARTVYQAQKDGVNYYTTDANDANIILDANGQKTQPKTTLHAVNGRYITGLQNTTWTRADGTIDSDRSATEGQLANLQDYVTQYHAQQTVDGVTTGGGYAVTAGDGSTVTRNLGEAVTIRGDADASTSAAWAGNISTTAHDTTGSITPDTITAYLNKDIRIGTPNTADAQGVDDDGSLYVAGVKLGVLSTTSTTNPETGETTTTTVRGADYGGYQGQNLASGTTGELWSMNRKPSYLPNTNPTAAELESMHLNNAANIGDIYNIANQAINNVGSAHTVVTVAGQTAPDPVPAEGQTVGVGAGEAVTGGNLVLQKTLDGNGKATYDLKLANDVTLGTDPVTDSATGATTPGALGSLNLKDGEGHTTVTVNGSGTGLITVGTDQAATETTAASTAIRIGSQASAEGDTNDKVNAVTGLGNKTWDADHITSGRAATEDQLQAVVNTTSGGFGLKDTAGNTVKQALNKQITVTGTRGNISTKATDTDSTKQLDISLNDVINLGTATTTTTTVNKDGSTTETVNEGSDSSITLTGKSGAIAKLDGGEGSLTLAGAKDANRLTITSGKGAVGVDGTDGAKGTDGMTRIVYTDSNKTPHTVATMDDGQKYAGDDYVAATETTAESNVITKKINQRLDIKGNSGDKALTDKNIGVKVDKNADGSEYLHVQLAKNLDLTADGSVKMGDTTVNNKGITIANTDETKTVSLTDGGLNNGGNQITNVASGEKASIWGTTDNPYATSWTEDQKKNANNAANMGDVYNAAKAAQDDANSKHTTVTVGKVSTDDTTVTKDADGYVTGGNLKLAKTTENGKDNYDLKLANDISIGEKGADGKDGVDGSIGVNGKDGSAVVINGKDGSIGLNGKDGANGVTIKGDKGTDGTTRVIYETKDGETTVKHELATMDDGQKYAGDNYVAATDTNAEQNVITKKMNQRLDIKGNSGDKALTDKNIGVKVDKNADGSEYLHVQLAKNLDLDADGSVKMGDTTVDKNGVTIKNTKDDSKTVSLTDGGLNNGGNQITNVASGEKASIWGTTDNPYNKDWTEDQQKNANNAANMGDVYNAAKAAQDDANSKHTAVTVNGGTEAPDDKGTYTTGSNLLLSKTTKDGKDTYDLKLSNDISIGEKGADGKDGVDGKIGVNGKDGSAVVINGKDGSIGLNGANGANGVTIKGDKGADGTTRVIYETKDGETTVKHELATMDDGQKYAGDDYKAAEGENPEQNVITKKMNERLDIKGNSGNKALTDKNIGVKVDKDEHGNEYLHVQLAKDLEDLNSVTLGDKNGAHTVINNSGMTVYNSGDVNDLKNVAITNTNISMGGQQIHNVAAGEADTDAVNVSQLKQEVAKANNTVSAGDNINVTTTGEGPKDYKVSLNNDVTLGKDGEAGKLALTDKSGNKTIEMDGDNAKVTVGTGDNAIELDGKTGVIKTGDVQMSRNGLVAGDKQITKVASGLGDTKLEDAKGDTLTNAANIGDLQKASNAINTKIDETNTTIAKGLNFKGDSGDAVNRKLGDTLNLNGGADAKNLSDNNIGVVTNTDGDGLDIKLSKDLTGMNSATFTTTTGSGDSAVTNTTVVNGGGVTVKDGSGDGAKDAVTLNKTGLAVNDGGKAAVTVDKSGMNIAAPTTPSDAANADSITRGAITISQETFTAMKDKDGNVVKDSSGKTVYTKTGGGISMGGNQVKEVASGIYGEKYADNSRGAVYQVNADGTRTNIANNAVNVGDLNQVASEITNNTNIAVNNVSRSVNRLSNRVNKVGAGAAALAALHPLDFDPDAKWDFAAGYGHYHNANAAAVGAYYRPNEDTMFSIGGSVGNGENMLNAGISVKLGQGNHITNSRVAMARTIQSMQVKMDAMAKEIETLKSTGAPAGAPAAKDVTFPDVPANHWAYEYVKSLADRGLIEGYPDGEFKGDRTMTRYEFAAIIYRALQNGAPVDGGMARSVDEFEPEIADVQKAYRFRVDRVAGGDNDRHKIERVRVNSEDDPANGDYRDVYGGKIQKAEAQKADKK